MGFSAADSELVGSGENYSGRREGITYIKKSFPGELNLKQEQKGRKKKNR